MVAGAGFEPATFRMSLTFWLCAELKGQRHQKGTMSIFFASGILAVDLNFADWRIPQSPNSQKLVTSRFLLRLNITKFLLDD